MIPLERLVETDCAHLRAGAHRRAAVHSAPDPHILTHIEAGAQGLSAQAIFAPNDKGTRRTVGLQTKRSHKTARRSL